MLKAVEDLMNYGQNKLV